MRNIAMTQVMRKNENYRMNPSTACGGSPPFDKGGKNSQKIYSFKNHEKTQKNY